VSAHGQKRRGVVDHLQTAGIIGLTERHESRAESFRCLDLARGVLAGGNPGRPLGAAAPGEIG